MMKTSLLPVSEVLCSTHWASSGEVFPGFAFPRIAPLPAAFLLVCCGYDSHVFCGVPDPIETAVRRIHAVKPSYVD